MKDKHDSGVGLTQQPSRQTMRHLKSSHSDKPFNSDEPRLGSSSRQARCTTSSSKTGHLEGLNSSPPPTSHQEEDAQHGQKDQDTVYLLTGASNPYTQWSVEEASDDVEVFLNPDAPLESSDAMLLSSSSPSFGLPNRFSANRQSQLNAQLEFLGESTGSPDGHYEYAPRNDNQPGVIIDSNGLKHILTTAEEVQRDAELRNAVMAKMGGAVGTNPASPSFPDPTTQGLHQKREAVSSRFQPPQSSGSKTKSFKWRDRSEPSPSERTVFDKITGFFKKRKDTRV
ncbi:hypothetical protein BDV25DRAFT_140264 [Aspergillus avenaceus]|uniref:Uncharacterized protein n=1 Tax=Aspergillus avenaceus TaxID=36643 RepID=A0A5N6TUG0_ASPAV|nr:hypothetical protein BDV25DRAFT_140264 [Aspergillus avenaceus]